MTDFALQPRDSWRTAMNAFRILAMSERTDEATGKPIVNEMEFVACALKGDGDAFGKLIEMHQATIASQMRRFSREHAVIEELVHDVFVEAYFSLRSYRANAPLVHWLRKIAVRVGYRYWKQRDHLRRTAGQQPEVEVHLEQLSCVTITDASSASQLLGDLLDQLRPRDRLVLTLLYWDGCTVAQAAELSGWSQSLVKVQAYRARNRLKQLIEDSQ